MVQQTINDPLDLSIVDNASTDETLMKTDPQEDTKPKTKAKFASVDPAEEVAAEDPNKGKAKFSGGGPQVVQDKMYKGLDIEDYTDYLGSSIFMPTGGVDALNKQRAMNQSGWEQAGNMLGQAVVGEIVGGTIEGLGYILDVGSALDYMTGNEKDWGNFMTEAGKGLRTWSQDAMAIHAENPGKFDPGDSGWWFSNGVSVASTLSMLIPSMAATKALGFLGKGASKLGGKMSRVLDVAGNMGKKATWMTEGISQAVVSRHIENAMEASGTFESAKADYLARTNKETGLPFTEEEATRLASEAAASNYNKGWAMLLQDIPQYLALGKIFNPHTGRMENALSKASQKGKSIDLKPWQQKVKTGIGTFLSEGTEESYQYYIAEQGKALADLNAGLITRDKYNEIMSDALGSDEMMTSAFFGGLGGNIFQVAGKGLNELGKGKKRREFERNYDETYKSTLNDRAKQFMSMQQKLSDADNNDNIEAREMVLDEMMLMMTTDALHRGKFDQHIEALEGVSNMTKEEAKALEQQGGGEFNLELAKKNIPEVIKKSEEMRLDYLKFSNKYEGNIAAKMAQNNYRTKRFVENSKKMDEKIQSITYSIPNINAMSSIQLNKVEGGIKLRALSLMNKNFKDDIKSGKINDLRKPHLEKIIKENEARISKLSKQYEAENKDDPRDADKKREDSRIAQGFTDEITDELVFANMIKERNNREILLNQLENDAIRSESYRNGLKKEALKEKVNSKIENEEQVEAIKKEIEDATFLTKDEKAAELATVNENIEELANEAAIAQEYKNDEAREAEKLAAVNEASKNTSTITNANNSKINDNVEDEFSEEETTVYKISKSKEKSQDKTVNTKAHKNIKVPMYSNLNGPGWKDWVFNGKDKTGIKDGKPVILDFIIGAPGGKYSELAQQAINIYNKAKASPKKKLTSKEKDVLFNHLPIKVQLTEEIWSYIPAFSPSNTFFKTNEFPKRKSIIRQMFKGNNKTQVTFQFGGNLNVEKTEDNTVPENNIMDFSFIKGNMGKVDLMVTNEFGTLVRVSDKADHPDFQGMQINVLRTQDDKGNPVPYKGGVFLNVPKANGDPFPLKLNLRKPNILEATFIADVMIAVITKKLGRENRLSDHPELFKRFKEDHPAEFSVLGKDAKTSDVTKLFVHMTDDTAGKETHLHYTGVWIHYGLGGEQGFKGIVTPENVADNREALIGFILNEKRRQLNLKQWNHDVIGAKYREMITSNVISTDAVVGSEKPLFDENKTLGRDNGLAPFKVDIGFAVPEDTPEVTEVAPKEATKANKDIDSRQAWSDSKTIWDERDGTFSGVYLDKNRDKIQIVGKNEAMVRKLIKERYDSERLAQPAQKAATVIKEVPAQEITTGTLDKSTNAEKAHFKNSNSSIQSELKVKEDQIEEKNRLLNSKRKNSIKKLKSIDNLLAYHFLLGKIGIQNPYGSDTSLLQNELKISFKEAEELVKKRQSMIKPNGWKLGDEYNTSNLDEQVEEELKEINAKYDAELEELEEQPVTSNQSKEAEIKRRMQKELDSLISEQEFIKAIFPDTKVKQVVYHGGPKNINKFNNEEIFFTTDEMFAEYYKAMYEDGTEKEGKVYKVILDIRNPHIVEEEIEFKDLQKQNNKDAVIGNRVIDSGGLNNQIIVYKSEQIHILTEIEQAKIDNEENRNKIKAKYNLLSSEENAIFTSEKAEVSEISKDLSASEEAKARNKMAERELKANKTVEVESFEEAKDAEKIDKKQNTKEIDPNVIRTEEQGDWDCII